LKTLKTQTEIFNSTAILVCQKSSYILPYLQNKNIILTTNLGYPSNYTYFDHLYVVCSYLATKLTYSLVLYKLMVLHLGKFLRYSARNRTAIKTRVYSKINIVNLV